MQELAAAYAQAVPPPKLVSVCGGSINGLDPCDDIQVEGARPTSHDLRSTFDDVHDPLGSPPSHHPISPDLGLQEATKRFNAAYPPGMPQSFQAYYTTIGKKDWQTINTRGSKYKGCDAHYSPLGHQVVADDIAPQLEAIMGW